MIVNNNFPAPGTEVGCSYRWPYKVNHPDCWEPPHKGVVLALDDPRAWRDTLAFPQRVPTQEECTAHVQKCLDDGLLKGDVPVLWTWTNSHEQMVAWDHNLRPYADELKAWRKARQSKLKGGYADR